MTTGATFTSCSGYYSGNLFNNASNADLRTGLDKLAGTTVGFSSYASIANANKLTSLNGSRVIDFGKTLYGDTVVGVHFGAGNGAPASGNSSVFYRFDAGTTGVRSFTLNYGASSNATLFATAANAVPEPAAWGLLIAGFGILGGVARRRRGQAVLAA